MRLRYFIESRLVALDPPKYAPAGVWVQGPGPGLDVVMQYLPGNEDLAEEADWVLNRLVEAGVKNLQPDFLDYHRGTMSPYHGARSEVVETEEFGSPEECARAVLAGLAKRPAA
jgi:hypothetical protein